MLYNLSKEDMEKYVLTLPDEMKSELSKISKNTGVPMARLIRDGIKLVLKEHGVDIDTTVEWGGSSKKDDNSD